MCFLEVFKTLATRNKLFNVHYILFYSPVAFAITSASNTELSAFGCSSIRLRNADQVLQLKACIYSCSLHTSDNLTCRKRKTFCKKAPFLHKSYPTHIRVVNSCPRIPSPLICESWFFEAHFLTDQLLNHDKINTAQKEILSGIHVVPPQRCTAFIIGHSYSEVSVFQYNATHESDDTITFNCYLNGKWV